MQKTGIEWTDYTSNPVRGYCPMACPYCYSRKIYDRFKWDKTIRFSPGELDKWDKAKPGSKIFVGSMIELFGDWVDESWLREIFRHVELYPYLTFQFLTKQPQNLAVFSPFPDNCWVGATATNAKMAEEAGFWLWEVKATVKFVSFEPLLERIAAHFADYISEDVEGIKWIILGSQTKPYKPPKIEWVQEIVDAADKAGIPVFLKDNLKPLLIEDPEYNIYSYPEWAGKQFAVSTGRGTPMRLLRQEMPE